MNGLSPRPGRLRVACLLVLVTTHLAADDRLQVEVFVDSRETAGPWSSLVATHPGLNLTVYDLAAPQQLTAAFSAGLPRDPAAAKQAAQQRLLEKKAWLADALKTAYAGLSRAMALGLNRTPAVVVNGEAILYGTADIDDALQRYQHWQGSRQP